MTHEHLIKITKALAEIKPALSHPAGYRGGRGDFLWRAREALPDHPGYLLPAPENLSGGGPNRHAP